MFPEINVVVWVVVWSLTSAQFETVLSWAQNYLSRFSRTEYVFKTKCGSITMVRKNPAAYIYKTSDFTWAAIKTPQEEFSIDLLTPIPSRKLALQLRKPRERSRGTFVYQSLRGRPAEEHIWYKVMMNRTVAEVPRKRKPREMHPRKQKPTPRKMRESFGGREWELTGIVLGFWTPLTWSQQRAGLWHAK